MFGTALIVFREVLEAALIVGIVGAATRGLAGRSRWIVGGVAAGILGALAVAAGAGALSSLAQGMGQELFNASILGIAVVMLGWHNIWMTVHGRELASNAKKIGTDIGSGALGIDHTSLDQAQLGRTGEPYGPTSSTSAY